MTDHPPSAATPAFKDTSTSLVVFGVLEIILGAVCALMVLLMIFAQLMASRIQNAPAQLSIQQMFFAAAIYLLLAVFFVAMGYGSIRARRWARALMLVWAWFWLVSGIIGLGYFCFLMPDIFAMAARQQGKTALPETMAAAKAVALGMLSVVYIILPGMFVLYYSSRNVKATCEWKDPKNRWTDRCPLPVLGLSLMLGLGVVIYPLTIIAYHGVFPFFGVILSGVVGSVAILISSCLWGYLAWALYKLKPAAWWGTIAVGVFYLLSSVVTFLQVDLIDFYRRMGLPERDLQLLKDFNHLEPGTMVGMMVASSLVYFGYMLFIKKYFREAVPHDSQV